MAVKFSMVESQYKEEIHEGFFAEGHVDEEIFDYIENMEEILSEIPTTDTLKVRIVHYMYIGDGAGPVREATEEELRKLEDVAYALYKKGLIVIVGGYIMEIEGMSTEGLDIVIG